MPAHKHAELMRQYAEDASRSETPWESWEYSLADTGEASWSPLDEGPRWSAHVEYRRKPKKTIIIIIINGFEINEPVRDALPYRAEYFLVLPTTGGKFHRLVWGGTEPEHEWLQHGLIHLTQEDAIAHAKALISFTEVKR